MPAILHQEWLNQNSYRNYPIREDVVPVPVGFPNITLPNYVLVDLVLTTAGDAGIALKLHKIAVAGNLVTCVFTDSEDAVVTTLAVDTDAHVPYASYQLVGQGDFEDARGIAVLGDLSRLTTDMPPGSYTFTDVWLEPCTVRPDIRGVRSLRIGFGDTLSGYIRGHVKLIEGSNIRLTYVASVNGIRIDAINGAGFNQTCDCEDAYQEPDCIRYINGIKTENVEITGDGKCVEVIKDGNKLIIHDMCSQPCCGCPELEFITNRLILQESVLKTVEQYVEQIRSQLTNTVDAMLASTKGG